MRVFFATWVFALASYAAAAAANEQLSAIQPASKLEMPDKGDTAWHWRVSSGFDFLTGKYGASRATDVRYAPLGISYTGGLWTLSADTGYIDISGPLSFIDIADYGLSEDEARTLGLGDATVQGFDNVTLGARYAAFDIWEQNLFVDLTAKVTMPTASRAKGLGTGAVDVSTIVDLTRMSGSMTWFASVSRKWRGGADTRRNSWSAGIGFTDSFTDRLSAGLSYDIRQSGIRGGRATHEGTLFASFKITESATLTAYALGGLPRDTIGTGVGVRLGYTF